MPARIGLDKPRQLTEQQRVEDGDKAKERLELNATLLMVNGIGA
jgi:hypothetical protein